MTKLPVEFHKLYGGEIELAFDVEKHHYTVDGETKDGVTSVLGIIAKPALISWAANMGGEYLEKNLNVGVVDEIQKQELVEGVKSAHRKFTKKAADIGTLFHDYVEAFIKGKKPEMPTNPMLKNGVKQFHAWVEQNNVEFKWSERKIYSKKYGYCGTLDFTAKIAGKNVVGDIKTSSGIWDEMWLQVAAYKQAIHEEFPEAEIDHTVIVRCGKDGSFEVKEMNHFEKNIEAFLAALNLYRWQKEMKYLPKP